MKPTASFLSPSILFEDVDILVLSKPAGIPSVNVQGTTNERSLATWLMNYNHKLKQVLSPSGSEEGGLCHRLDTETSGVIVAAKNSSAYSNIRAQFSARTVRKLYLALIEGKLPTSSLQLINFLGGRHRSSKKVSVFPHEGKRTSRAELEVCQKEYISQSDISVVVVNLHTGFRHQIRAQLAALGYPLVGDKLYGSTRELPKDLQRRFLLHAHSLTLQHPSSGEQMTFEDQGEPLVLSAKGLL